MGRRFLMYSETTDFLGGTFHQDILSPKDALEEFIKDTTQLGIKQTIDHCVTFLNSNLTDHEKEKIIQIILKSIFLQSL
ncbi:contact-dependent growth inhibition system immunity protein [Terribacillus saccharophilus]|uniref:contact-dependent growth inhibition system immunity protein n=1 Tax=Terribacillus saccharophilus TaxID=361277 RepID=UPI0038262C19